MIVENQAEFPHLASSVALPSPEERLRRTVQDVLSATARPAHLVERRREQRTPYPHLFRIAPVAADGVTPVGEGIVVVGKHLSPRGVDFYHQSPVPHRRMLAWFDGSSGQTHIVLLELLWCRFNRNGWYENGGRLLKAVVPQAGGLFPANRPTG